MRKGQFVIGLFLIFFLLGFTVPTIIYPDSNSTTGGFTPEISQFTPPQSDPSRNLVVVPSDEGSPLAPDNPLGTGRETLIEWWDTNYDYRRKITIVEPDIATRSPLDTARSRRSNIFLEPNSMVTLASAIIGAVFRISFKIAYSLLVPFPLSLCLCRATEQKPP